MGSDGIPPVRAGGRHARGTDGLRASRFMKVRIWGCRGSLASPGPDTLKYGGNTSCVEVRGEDGTVLVLDAGTGMGPLGFSLERETYGRIDVLLSHLHLDHLQGLGFFRPLYQPGREIHIWGPSSPVQSLTG